MFPTRKSNPFCDIWNFVKNLVKIPTGMNKTKLQLEVWKILMSQLDETSCIL